MYVLFEGAKVVLAPREPGSVQIHPEGSPTALVMPVEVLQHPVEQLVHVVLRRIHAGIDHGATIALGVGPRDHGIDPKAWNRGFWTGTYLAVLLGLVVQGVGPHGRVLELLRWPRTVVTQAQTTGCLEGVVAGNLAARNII